MYKVMQCRAGEAMAGYRFVFVKSVGKVVGVPPSDQMRCCRCIYDAKNQVWIATGPADVDEPLSSYEECCCCVKK